MSTAVACCVINRPTVLPSKTLAAIFAVDSLLDFVGASAEKIVWSELNAAARESECCLFPVTDVRRLLTPESLDEVLEQPTSHLSERVLALFARRILELKRGWCERVAMRLFHKAIARRAWGVAHALLERTRTKPARTRFAAAHLTASRNILIEPSAEYCSLLLAMSPRASILMHGCDNAHQFCRLLVAIRLQHQAALVWLEAISLLERESLVWWRGNVMCLGITAVSPTVLAHVVAFAALVGNDDFVHRALGLHGNELERETPVFHYYDVGVFPPPLPLTCPFTTQHSCCRSTFDGVAVARACATLPASLHAHVSFVAHGNGNV